MVSFWMFHFAFFCLARARTSQEVPDMRKQPARRPDKQPDAGGKKKGNEDLDMCSAISPFKSDISAVTRMIGEARQRKERAEEKRDDRDAAE